MQVYLVGGAVRDMLLGLEPKDKDYVVVGSSVEEMLSLGFKQVGKDFPVFLHPETGNEYALARTERSTGAGHHSFTVSVEHVPLEDDLHRRDLTINALAFDGSSGTYLGDLKGIADCKGKVLRHVAPAFAEDPLRILRLFRFAATLPGDWTIAEETLALVHQMVLEGAMRNLTKERVWKETEKALKGDKPWAYFDLLREHTNFFPMAKAMQRTPQPPQHHPEGNVWVHTCLTMESVCKGGGSPEVVFAALCHDLGKPVAYSIYGNLHGHESIGLPVVDEVCELFGVPKNYHRLALLVCEFHTKVHKCRELRPSKLHDLLVVLGAFNLQQQEQFINVLKACRADARGGGKDHEHVLYEQMYYLSDAAQVASAVTGKHVPERYSGKAFGDELRAMRIKQLKAFKQGRNRVTTYK